jgi:hypothetical protein
MDRERVVLEGCYDLQLSAKGLLDSIGELWPVELATAGGDPDGPSSLDAVAERLDDCRARLDALRRSVAGPSGRDPRSWRARRGGSPLDH